jgi:hypothetical protein
MARFQMGFLLFALSACAVARAEVSQASPSGFIVTERREVSAAPASLVKAMEHVADWWGDTHTYSERAANLSLEARAGGCFCERWADGSVEHARVIYAAPGIVRLSGALGPLQGLAVSGVLTFAIQAPEGGARDSSKNLLVVTYRIGGGEAADMQRLPAMVDAMMGETTDKLARYLGAGAH